jgi:hypothetical protein
MINNIKARSCIAKTVLIDECCLHTDTGSKYIKRHLPVWHCYSFFSFLLYTPIYRGDDNSERVKSEDD